MPIRKREEELYKRDYELKIESPHIGKKIPVETPKPGELWGKTEQIPPPPELPKVEGKIEKTKKWATKILAAFLWAALGIAIIGIGVYFLFKWWSKPNILISIDGPKEVRSGDKITYQVLIQNSGSAKIEDAYISLKGDGVLFEDGPEKIIRRAIKEGIYPSSSRREDFSVYFLGKEGDEREIEVSLHYRLSNIPKELVKTEKIKTKIAASSVSVILDLPKQTLSSTDFSFRYEIKNISELDPIKYLSVEFIYPDDFTFIDANYAGEEGKKWTFTELYKNSPISLSIKGKLTAEAGQTRSFKAILKTKVRDGEFILNETKADIIISENPLMLAMSVNGQTSYNTKPGDTLDYKITFKNNFSETLRDIVIVAKLSGDMFDFKKLTTSAAFDSRNMTLTFNGGNTPVLLFLKPQEAGEVSFRIGVLDKIPEGLYFPTLSVEAEMTSGTKLKYLGVEEPLKASASLTTKVRGEVEISQKVLIRDTFNNFSVSGPWPLRANQTTYMSVRWKIRALGNNFENISLSSIFAPGVSYAGQIERDYKDSQLVVDPRTSKIEWKIPKLSAFRSAEIAFKIAVTPSILNVGNVIPLLNNAKLSGIDSSTGEIYEISLPVTRSDMLNDPTISNPFDEGVVRE
jgi:hypothetical protein